MNLTAVAEQLYRVHGLLPVPVAGKVPLGGNGWNTFPLEQRLALMPQATGLGIQFGLTFHPKLGPVEARAIDADIDNEDQRNAFPAVVPFVNQWRWGRRPATIIFTQPGIIKQERFGPVQLLGAGKQAVWFGRYQNKSPLPTDPPEYWHQGPSIFEQLPPLVEAAALKHALETAYPQKSMLIEHAVALSSDDLATLSADTVTRFRNEIKSMLIDLENMPTGSGRGAKLHHMGLRYGALIKASGAAPALCDAARELNVIVEFQTIKKHAFLQDIGAIAEEAFLGLPGTLGAGDQRDFARGVGASKGLGQAVAVEKEKHALLMPTGREHPGQTASDLLRLNLSPMSYLVDRFLPDTGCIILAGKPKVGKGWIIMDLALSVVEGGIFWGERARQGGVLMYMLEDGPRRLTERLRIMHPALIENAHNLRFRYSADGPFYVDSAGTGSLLDDITKHLKDFKIRLVIVDVLQRVRGTVERSDNAYQVDYKVVAALQKLAVQNGILILVVHHTKKGKVDDAIDGISGSFGIIGAADGAIIVGKEGDVMRAQSTMRDIPDFEFDLIKEDGNPMWKPANVDQSFGPNMKPNGVLHALAAAACELHTGDIAIRSKLAEATTAVYLGRLVKSGQAVRTSRGFYKAAGLPQRDRIEGVKDVIKSMLLTPVSEEIEAKYAPKGAPPGATFMVLTDKVLSEIKACFSGEKKALDMLKQRGLLVYNSDTTWLIGGEWQTKHQTEHPNPFAMKMPWE